MQVIAQNSGRSLVLLGTGGTISGRAAIGSDNLGYAVGEVDVDDLVAALPGEFAAGLLLVTEQVAQVDSKDMDIAVWQRLEARCRFFLSQSDVRGVVITHGTDTLEETAFFLSRVLADSSTQSKVVVLTGAMRPASSLSPDGPGNLRDALTVAAHPAARGVVVVMAGRVFAGAEVQKVHAYRVDAFESPDAGPLAYVEEANVRSVRPWPTGEAEPLTGLDVRLTASAWPSVEIVMSHAGASAYVVDALLAHGDATGTRLHGLVVAGTGNGTIHQELEVALLRAQARGVTVLRSTRCAQGRVLPTRNDLFPHAGGLPPAKARIALMLDLLGQQAGGSPPPPT